MCNLFLFGMIYKFKEFVSRFERLFSLSDSKKTMKYSIYLVAHTVCQTIIYTFYPIEILR